MQRAVFPVVSLALGVASLLSAAHLASRPPEIPEHVATLAPMRHNDVSSGAIARALAVVSNLGDDRTDVMKRVRDAEPGTYIGDILRERDSSLARWPDRHGVPLTVWIQPNSAVQDFGTGYVDAVRDELRRRIGPTFTASELADLYGAGTDWALEAVRWAMHGSRYRDTRISRSAYVMYL